MTLTPQKIELILDNAQPHIVSFGDSSSTVEQDSPISPAFISISNRKLQELGFTELEINAFDNLGPAYDAVDYDSKGNRDRYVFFKPELEKMLQPEKINGTGHPSVEALSIHAKSGQQNQPKR